MKLDFVTFDDHKTRRSVAVKLNAMIVRGILSSVITLMLRMRIGIQTGKIWAIKADLRMF